MNEQNGEHISKYIENQAIRNRQLVFNPEKGEFEFAPEGSKIEPIESMIAELVCDYGIDVT